VAPRLILVSIFAWISYRLTITFPETKLPLELPTTGAPLVVHLPLFLLLTLILLVRPLTLLLNSHYELGTHHLRATTGKASFHKRFVEIPYEDLLTIEVDQNILDRLLCVGNVSAGSAMTNQQGILMTGILHPDRIAKELGHRVDLARQKAKR